MKTAFEDILDLSEENFLEELPNHFGMKLNLSGVKEDGVFSVGIHYCDSEGGEFNVEAEGANEEDLINSLIVNFAKIPPHPGINNNRNEKNYNILKDKYDVLMKENQNLKKNYDKLTANYNKLTEGYSKLYNVLNKAQQSLDSFS